MAHSSKSPTTVPQISPINGNRSKSVASVDNGNRNVAAAIPTSPQGIIGPQFRRNAIPEITVIVPSKPASNNACPLNSTKKIKPMNSANKPNATVPTRIHNARSSLVAGRCDFIVLSRMFVVHLRPAPVHHSPQFYSTARQAGVRSRDQATVFSI